MIEWFNLPNLRIISLGRRSFRNTSSISLSSTSLILSSLDVPFLNGHFSMSTEKNFIGEYTFRHITSSSITSDSTSSHLRNCIMNKWSSWSLSCFLHISTPLRCCTHLKRIVPLPFFPSHISILILDPIIESHLHWSCIVIFICICLLYYSSLYRWFKMQRGYMVLLIMVHCFPICLDRVVYYLLLLTIPLYLSFSGPFLHASIIAEMHQLEHTFLYAVDYTEKLLYLNTCCVYYIQILVLLQHGLWCREWFSQGYTYQLYSFVTCLVDVFKYYSSKHPLPHSFLYAGCENTVNLVIYRLIQHKLERWQEFLPPPSFWVVFQAPLFGEVLLTLLAEKQLWWSLSFVFVSHSV